MDNHKFSKVNPLVLRINAACTIFLSLFLFLLFPFSAYAGRYYDEAEMATYTIADATSPGRTFYVDGMNGDDSNDGLSPDKAYKTLKHAFWAWNGNRLMGGDVVKIKAGIYRESISLSFIKTQKESLTTDTPITIGPYGDGEVIIDPSSTPTSWTAYDANIFVANWPNSNYPPWAVVLDDDFKACRDKRTLAELTSYGLWWYDSANKKIYIHTGGVDPATLDPVITFYNRSAEHYGLKLGGLSHIRVYGLTFRGAARYGITDYGSAEDIHIEKCTIKFNNGNGVRLFSSHSKLIKNHSYGNMLYNWPRGRIYAANGGWGQGMTISNHGLASGNIVHDNGGEGIGVYGGDGHTIFEDNISYDNYSVGLYLDNAPHCIFRRNLIYSHNPNVADRVEDWQLPQWIIDGGQGTIDSQQEKILARMRQEGIATADEKATNTTATGIGHKIYNNIIIGSRRGYLHYANAEGSGLRDFVITNNTIILPSVTSTYGWFAGIVVSDNSGNNTNTVIKNNIVYSPTAEPVIFLPHGANTTGVDINNNVYHAPNNPTPFRSGIYPNQVNHAFTDWKSLLAGIPVDTNSINLDPLFVGEVGDFIAASYLLSDCSPIKSAGPQISDYTDDFNGNARDGVNWDIGALAAATAPSLTMSTPRRLRIK